MSLPLVIITGGTGYSEPTGSWGGTLGTDRFVNVGPATAAYAFTGLTPGTAYAIGLRYNEFTNRVTNASWSVAGTSSSPSGTINQQVAVQQFPGTGTSRIFLPQSFMPTGTTLTLTVSYPASPSPSGNYVETVAGYLDLVSNINPIPSVQDGNWSAGSTWALGLVPGSGVDALIQSNITMDADTTVGSSPSTGGTPAIAFGTVAGKTLTLAAGKTLTAQGPVLITASSGGTGQIVLDAGANLAIKPASGQQYTITFNEFGQIVSNGTSGSHCTIATDLSLGGLPSYMVGDGASRTQGVITATFTDFSNFGDSSHLGVSAYPGPPGTTNITITDCTFAYSSLETNDEGNTWDANFTVARNKFVSSAGFTIDGVACCWKLQLSQVPSVGTRTIDGNTFDLAVYSTGLGPASIAFTNNYFGDRLLGSGLAPWGSFDGNFHRHTGSPASLDPRGDTTNNFLFIDDPLSTPLDDWFLVPSADISAVKNSIDIAGNIFYHNGNNPDGELIVVGGNSYANVMTINWKLNLSLPNGFDGHASGNGLSVPQDGTTLRLHIEHNTFWQNGGASIEMGELQTVVESPNRYQSYKANLFVGNLGTGSKSIYNGGASLVDVLPPSIADYNGSHGLAAMTGTGTNSGNGYGGYFSVTPGPHDISADPLLVDQTRSLASWAGTQGPTATDAAALLLIQATPTLTKSSLLPYLRGGYVPTNAVYAGATYPGDPATTDANGQPLGGTIGAMAFNAAVTVATRRNLSFRAGSRGAA